MTYIDQSKLRSVQFLLENNFSEAIPDFDKAIELNPNGINCVLSMQVQSVN